jgi:hypothetical protein
MFFTWAGSEVEGWPDPSPSSVQVSNFEMSEPFVVHRLTQGIIAVSFTQHVVGFCSCFPYFETKFNTYSLPLADFMLHATRQQHTRSQNLL